MRGGGRDRGEGSGGEGGRERGGGSEGGRGPSEVANQTANIT